MSFLSPALYFSECATLRSICRSVASAAVVGNDRCLKLPLSLSNSGHLFLLRHLQLVSEIMTGRRKTGLL